MAAMGISPARPPLQSLGLKTNAEYFAYLRSSGPPPSVGAAGYDLAAGLYEEAVGDTENIEAYIGLLEERDTEGARRGVGHRLEGPVRTMRAKALAGLRRGEEAVEQLEQAEACIRQVPGIKPTHPYDLSQEIAPGARESIAEVWEMLDDPAREAAILEPVPTHEELITGRERWRDGWQRMAERGQEIEPRLLEPVTSESVAYADMHTIRYWAARMEAVLRGDGAADDIRDMAATALGLVGRSPLRDLAVAHRCRAVAHEVLGDRKRALDGWQRYILSLMAMYEPDRSPLFDRAWAQVERLGGRR
jgi:hypothetical protein